MKGIKIIGLGGAIPTKTVTNDALGEIMDTSDAWIYPRTGIHERRFCSENESALTLAIEAGRKAISDAGIRRENIGAVVVASMSPDLATPSMSAIIQRELELPLVPALDLNAACSGFIYALEVARGLLSADISGDVYNDTCIDVSKTPKEKYALVIGTEQLSRLISMEDRSTAILFGDGAGAAVVALEETDTGKTSVRYATENKSDSTYVSILGSKGSGVIEAPSVYERAYENGCRRKTDAEKIDHMLMDGKDVFVFACDVIPRIINSLLRKTGLSLEDINHVVCHQANARIIRHVIRAMHAPEEKFFMNMEKLGNVSAASIPIALYDMKCKGLMSEGDRMILAGFGGGLTWGGCIISYK
ncbi:3-oxoacyl-[acyl-carrier-protein] synthase-3 [Oribacterium sp. WCC10]|nr:beta-ketoacyl-ACP synthase 3 [Oribacterium sp. WCC10]SFG81551.1 3-oxoacyl-[acyl-carrier-protein] synthase-3 [Oribacterium sp. WCC10]